MGKPNRTYFLFAISVITSCFVAIFAITRHKSTCNNDIPAFNRLITDSISRIASAYPGEIGVAVIINNTDTITVNNRPEYPLMSVFKLHQALAICKDFDNKELSIDSIISFSRDSLDAHTWSPMMKDHTKQVISMSVRELLQYALILSDNNASNVMFKRLVNVAETDSFIATVIPRSSFRIACTEEEMSADHTKAYANNTSPLGAAILINRLFTDNIVSQDSRAFLMETLHECQTGKDRIAAPLLDIADAKIAHKTGSGYIDKNGVLTACNDVAYITLSDNVRYSLAIFVKNFHGDEKQAAKAIAHISAVLYDLISHNIQLNKS